MKKPGYYILKVLLSALGHLPLKVLYALGDFISWTARKLIHYREQVVTVNVARSFPDLKYHEIKQIVKDFYRHFGELVAETLWFGGCTNPKRLVRQDLVRIEDASVLNHLYEVSPSVVILNTHCGNWELFGGIGSYVPAGSDFKVKEENMCVVYKKMSSESWDAVLSGNRIAPLLDREGFEGLIESQDIIRYMIRHRGEKKFYNFNNDQYPYAGSGKVDVGEFMHQQTYAMAAAANLARKFGMSVAYMNIDRKRRGHYEMRFTSICEDASKMETEDILKKYYELLQKDIEANPGNYLWTHKRWK